MTALQANPSVKNAILILTVFIFCLTLPTKTSLASETSKVTSKERYKGTINKNIHILVDLNFYKNRSLEGSYYYLKNRVRIPLKGSFDTGYGFELVERAPRDEKIVRKGDITGYFRGKFDKNFTHMTGVWSNASGSKSFTFELRKVESGEAGDDKPNITGGIFDSEASGFDDRAKHEDDFTPKVFAEILNDGDGRQWKLTSQKRVVVKKNQYLFTTYDREGVGSIVIAYKQINRKMMRAGGYQYIFGGNGASCSVGDWKVVGNQLELRTYCIGYFHQMMPEGEMPPTEKHDRVVVLDLFKEDPYVEEDFSCVGMKDGPLEIDGRFRMRADLNFDGKEDLILSRSKSNNGSGCGTGGCSVTIYLKQSDGSYQPVEFGLHPAAVSLKKIKIGVGNLFTYWHMSAQDGVLATFRVDANSISEQASKTIHPTMSNTDEKLYQSMFGNKNGLTAEFANCKSGKIEWIPYH